MISSIISAFTAFMPYSWAPADNCIDVLKNLISYAKCNNYKVSSNYEKIFLEAVCQKLSLNKSVYRNILDVAYAEGVKFNYLEKEKISQMLDYRDGDSYEKFLKEKGCYTESLYKAFAIIDKEIVVSNFKNIYCNDKLYHDVYSSIFSRYCFNLFEKKCAFEFFSGVKSHKEDFFDFMEGMHPKICGRRHALSILDVDSSIFLDYKDACNYIFSIIKDEYENLDNHCILSVYIPNLLDDSVMWRLYSDIILYSEKLSEEKIDKKYFKWKNIENDTCNYIKEVVPRDANFEYAFQGFVFKDCFILKDNENKYSLLLVLEKNKRDERVICCPACRSISVQGNSYPILNVKSWECQNVLCPDRSRYNRGKRYSFMSLFRQKEIMNDDNLISNNSISKWHLDCVEINNKNDVFEMLIKHYSFCGDGVVIYSNDYISKFDKMIKRNIFVKKISTNNNQIYENFKKCPYFNRYIHINSRDNKEVKSWKMLNSRVFCGDALDALRTLKSNSVDGVVTSPPYYNAKSYSKWPNIYCYLYDMYNIAVEVYKVMKEGGILLYNIFDYFDNENNIVFSAMGNKRMILGAYAIDMFERIGFEVVGNIIWNKGEIQGNRSFNQGNNTPYYQAPLNCWEHVLIFSKGKPDKKYDSIISEVKDIRPVVKMIKGKNIIGHDAPFPRDIPELLIKHMSGNDVVLDPFLGSGTTCIVANKYGIESIGIEKKQDYFELCQTNIRNNCSMQLSLV